VVRLLPVRLARRHHRRKQFFSGLDAGSAAFIFALLAFAAGFIVRPFGALVFGRLGDLIGRKYTFLVTILIMGLSTFIVGMLPSYASWGVAAPIILIALRMLQGLALGGEYGGAATYVAEHAPQPARLLHLLDPDHGDAGPVPVADGDPGATSHRRRSGRGEPSPPGAGAFRSSSRSLLAISVWIRLQMNESPAFQKMKAEGKTSKAPLREAFGQWKNLKIALIALVGLTAGQAVVWYSGQFYALFFLTERDQGRQPPPTSWWPWSLILGTPFFIVFGSLSDKIGRKPIILAGCLLRRSPTSRCSRRLTKAANPTWPPHRPRTEVIVTADPAECSFQFNPTGTASSPARATSPRPARAAR
jgi:hypothetical protein